MRLCALTTLWLGLTLITIDAWASYFAPRRRGRQEDLEELDTLVGCRSDNGHKPYPMPETAAHPCRTGRNDEVRAEAMCVLRRERPVA